MNAHMCRHVAAPCQHLNSACTSYSAKHYGERRAPPPPLPPAPQGQSWAQRQPDCKARQSAQSSWANWWLCWELLEKPHCSKTPSCSQAPNCCCWSGTEPLERPVLRGGHCGPKRFLPFFALRRLRASQSAIALRRVGELVDDAERQRPMHVLTCESGPVHLEEGASGEASAALLPGLGLRNVRVLQLANYCESYVLIGLLAHNSAGRIEDAKQGLAEHVVINVAVDLPSANLAMTKMEAAGATTLTRGRSAGGYRVRLASGEGALGRKENVLRRARGAELVDALGDDV